MEALVDTGSQVTTITTTLSNSLKLTYHEDILQMRLTAADGLAMPLVGCVVTDVTVEDHTIDDAVVMVTGDPPYVKDQPACILGMNILQRLKNVPSVLFPMPPKPDNLFDTATYLVRATSSPTMIPANTMVQVKATALGSGTNMEVLVEPARNSPRTGLSVLATYVTVSNGHLLLPVANFTDEPLLLPRRAVLGVVHQATEVQDVSVQHLDADVAEENPQQTHRVKDPPSLPDLSQLHLSDSLKPAERAQIESLVTKYADCFAWTDTDLGFTDRVKHRIYLTDDHPIKQPYRRVPPSVLTEVKSHIEDLLEKGIIQPSSSPYSSPIVLVRKKSGDIRLCIDYRRLNSITKRDSFPLPRIDECLDALGGSKYFSTLDLASGYHQVAMDDEDKAKTAFTCPFGLYEWNRMPMGLCNSPATFQRLMQSVMQEYIFNILLVYLDDLLLYSKTFSDHLRTLELVFIRLRQVGVKLQPSKCQIAQTLVAFLGHEISEEGISTDPGKVSAIQGWKTPSTAKEVRSFLGLASYYRRFVKHFAKIARPLHAIIPLIHQRHPSDRHRGERQPLGELWSPECQQAFATLKEALVTPPILGFADYTKDFIVEVDASLEGLGAVLSQEQPEKRVIAYASRSLRPTEKKMPNYSSLKLELLGLKWAVTEKFRGYLLGHKFVAYTDNNPLAHWQTAKFGAVEQRWIAELSAFNFSVRYKPGRNNTNADELSRNPVEEPVGPGEEFVAVTSLSTSSSNPVSVLPRRTDLWPSRPQPAAREETGTDCSSTCPASVSIRDPKPSPPPADPVEIAFPTLVTNVNLHFGTAVPADLASKIHRREGIDAPCVARSCTLTATLAEMLGPNDLAAAQAEDPCIAPLRQHVTDHTQPSQGERSKYSADTTSLLRHLSTLRLVDGILCRVTLGSGATERSAVIVPNKLQERMFSFAHDKHGHQGPERTLLVLRERCFWPHLADYVTDACRRCQVCQQTKRPAVQLYQPPGHLVATTPLEVVSVDFLKVDTAANGQENILVMTDVFSKWAVAVPTKDQTAGTVVHCLLHHWIFRYGVPLRIHSDKGRQFESEVVRLLCRRYGIDKSRTTSYHPAGNAQCERYNRTLLSLLTVLPHEQRIRWPEHIAEVVFFYNSTPHASTGLSPYALLFGRKPRLPIDLFLNLRAAPASETEDYLARHLDNIERLRQQARDTAAKHRPDPPLPHRYTTLKVGDLVRKKIPHGRKKIANLYGEDLLTVTACPAPQGPYVYMVRNGKGNCERVNGDRLKLCPPERRQEQATEVVVPETYPLDSRPSRSRRAPNRADCEGY